MLVAEDRPFCTDPTSAHAAWRARRQWPFVVSLGRSGQESGSLHASSYRREMTYSFRHRITLGSASRLSCPDEIWVLHDDREERVVLAAPEGTSIAAAAHLVLRGDGYASESEAESAGRRWGDRLRSAFAAINALADFGPPKPTSGFTAAGLQMFAPEGTRALNDVHGLQVFETEPPPVFLRMGPVAAQVSSGHDRLQTAMDRAVAADIVLTERQKTAHALYAASGFIPGGDSRFLMLMMAVETLTVQAPRPVEVRDHVDRLIAETTASGLDSAEIESLVSTLKWLRSESIGQAGRRLAATLEPLTFDGMDPVTFFRRCYALRSELVHGTVPRPDAATVGRFAANLEHFVANLLTPPVLVEDVLSGQ